MGRVQGLGAFLLDLKQKVRECLTITWRSQYPAQSSIRLLGRGYSGMGGRLPGCLEQYALSRPVSYDSCIHSFVHAWMHSFIHTFIHSFIQQNCGRLETRSFQLRVVQIQL